MSTAMFKGHIYLSSIAVVRRAHESGYPIDYRIHAKQPVLVTVSSANDDETSKEAVK